MYSLLYACEICPSRSHPEHVESMRIEKWEAGAKVERTCLKMTEFLVIEGEAHSGEMIEEK